jgi:serine protease Do
MLSKLSQAMQNRPLPVTALALVAATCFSLGLGLASGLHWTQAPVAAALTAPTPVAPTVAATPVALSPATPGSFAELAAKLSPTVVNVKVVKVEKVGNFPSFSQEGMPEGPFKDFFDKFFQDLPHGTPNMPGNPQGPRVHGAGSGVIISKDGYVLTNNHVIEGAKEVTVTLADHQEYKARIVGRDPKTDLAVLKIEAPESLPAAALGDSDNLRVGDGVMAIGNPFGLNNTVTSGIVSAKGRVIGAGPYDNFIQTDASINPGNSGGPLFNMNGEVVGINTAIIAQGQGIGFAIPVNTVKPLIPQLETKGEVTRGYLGVGIQTITPNLMKAMNLKGRKGALVADVTANGPAAQAGIQQGDVIVAYNGKEVGDSHDLPALVAATPIGQEAKVTVLRNSDKLDLPVKVGQLPGERADNADVPEGAVQPAKEKWGLALRDLNPEMAGQLHLRADKGAVVAGIKPGSRAEEAGMQRGDLILEVNRQPVASVKDALDKINGAPDKDHLLLLVQRGHNKLFVPLENVG